MIDWLIGTVRVGSAERRVALGGWFVPAGFDYGVEDIYLAFQRDRAGRN